LTFACGFASRLPNSQAFYFKAGERASQMLIFRIWLAARLREISPSRVGKFARPAQVEAGKGIEK
jgi:hypothetical protein